MRNARHQGCSGGRGARLRLGPGVDRCERPTCLRSTQTRVWFLGRSLSAEGRTPNQLLHDRAVPDDTVTGGPLELASSLNAGHEPNADKSRGCLEDVGSRLRRGREQGKDGGKMTSGSPYVPFAGSVRGGPGAFGLRPRQREASVPAGGEDRLVTKRSPCLIQPDGSTGGNQPLKCVDRRTVSAARSSGEGVLKQASLFPTGACDRILTAREVTEPGTRTAQRQIVTPRAT